MERALLIPVKELANAKQRLSPLLAPGERQELARLMLSGVLEQVGGLAGPLRKVIVTSDEPAMALGGSMGFEIMPETQQISESDSVDRACAQLEREGVDGVLRVPLDLPLLAAGDLERVLALADEGLAAVLVPSADGTGTNALYRAPPGLFPSRFGPGSLALHEQLARERRAPYVVENLPSLALDIDDVADLRALLGQEMSCPVKDFLEGLGVRARLEEAASSGKGRTGEAKSGS